MVSIESCSNLVSVIHGASSGEFNMAGYTVSSVHRSLLDAFNLKECRLAFVNSLSVPASYRLNGGDTLEFSIGWGRKGSDREEDPRSNEGKRYEQHPYGKVWQPFDDKTFAEFGHECREKRTRSTLLVVSRHDFRWLASIPSMLGVGNGTKV